MVKYLRLLGFTAFIISMHACNLPKKRWKNDAAKSKEELLKTDRDFSDMSETKGMKAAFLEYIDSNGVLLRPNRLPIVGADAVDYLISLNDTSYKMSWSPKQAVVASSGDLGYTYGLYEVRPAQQDTVLYGTYISIWKREENGKWKFVLDSGNEGIGDDE